MEYVSNGSLKDYFAENPGDDLIFHMRIAYDTAAALAHLHMHDVMHTNLKPGNILLESRDPGDPVCVKLTDLRTLHLAGEPWIDGGDLAYVCPEVIQGYGPTKASDVYSYAMVLYEGKFVSDKRHGRGKQQWVDGRVYEGMWRDDKMHGYGTCTWPTGALYEGHYRAGNRHGLGIYLWADGARYEGEFRDDTIDGWGTIREAGAEKNPALDAGVIHQRGTLIANFDVFEARDATCEVEDLPDAPLMVPDIIFHKELACYKSRGVRLDVVAVLRVTNKTLDSRLAQCVRALEQLGRDKGELAKVWAFHGCSRSHIKSVCRLGLLRAGHPLNPAAPPTAIGPTWDQGWFGKGTRGVYVTRFADHAARWSNGDRPLELGDEVEVVMLRACLGRSFAADRPAPLGGLDPQFGYDSHTSPPPHAPMPIVSARSQPVGPKRPSSAGTAGGGSSSSRPGSASSARSASPGSAAAAEIDDLDGRASPKQQERVPHPNPDPGNTEWFLVHEALCAPRFVLRLRAVSDATVRPAPPSPEGLLLLESSFPFVDDPR
eukprot:m51a1_g3010 putative morn repeat protein (545) ;mRNA; f:847329-850305